MHFVDANVPVRNPRASGGQALTVLSGRFCATWFPGVAMRSGFGSGNSRVQRPTVDRFLFCAGLFTPFDSMAEELAAASKAAGEKLWRMPMEEA
jgi:hypothetical protein